MFHCTHYNGYYEIRADNEKIGDRGDLNIHSIQGSIVKGQYHKAMYLGQKMTLLVLLLMSKDRKQCHNNV